MRILVVDDDVDHALYLLRLLDKLGHEPIIAVHPADALDTAGLGVHGIISDLDMPEMSGVELAAAVRERWSTIPIVFCTGSRPDAESVARARAIGPVFTKPGSLALVRRLVGALESRVAPCENL